MVDRVCMSESNRRGKLCFREDVSCNEAAKNQPNLFEFLAAPFQRKDYSSDENNLPTLVDGISSVMAGFNFMSIIFSNGLLSIFLNNVNIYIIQITIIQLMYSSLNSLSLNDLSIQFLWSEKVIFILQNSKFRYHFHIQNMKLSEATQLLLAFV